MRIERRDEMGPRFSRITVYSIAVDFWRWKLETQLADAQNRRAPLRDIEIARHKLAVILELAERDPR